MRTIYESIYLSIYLSVYQTKHICMYVYVYIYIYAACLVGFGVGLWLYRPCLIIVKPGAILSFRRGLRNHEALHPSPDSVVLFFSPGCGSSSPEHRHTCTIPSLLAAMSGLGVAGCSIRARFLKLLATPKSCCCIKPQKAEHRIKDKQCWDSLSITLKD